MELGGEDTSAGDKPDKAGDTPKKKKHRQQILVGAAITGVLLTLLMLRKSKSSNANNQSAAANQAAQSAYDQQLAYEEAMAGGYAGYGSYGNYGYGASGGYGGYSGGYPYTDYGAQTDQLYGIGNELSTLQTELQTASTQQQSQNPTNTPPTINNTYNYGSGNGTSPSSSPVSTIISSPSGMTYPPAEPATPSSYSSAEETAAQNYLNLVRLNSDQNNLSAVMNTESSTYGSGFSTLVSSLQNGTAPISSTGYNPASTGNGTPETYTPPPPTTFVYQAPTRVATGRGGTLIRK